MPRQAFHVAAELDHAAAEGELYREALVQALQGSALRVTGVPERDLQDRAAAAVHLPLPELRRRVADLGRACGPPWAQDQKLAALAAWLALAAARQSGQGTWGERW